METTTTLIETKEGTVVAIPKAVLESAGLSAGDVVTLAARDGAISITRKPSNHDKAMDAARLREEQFGQTLADLAR
jgi:antitoxin component of MazEF toxin-antitoxin module